MSQKERLEKELEQLTKTYKAGIINEKEFQKGKERIDEKLASALENAKKEEEGKKIIKDILEEQKPQEEIIIVPEIKPEPQKKPQKPKQKPVKKKDTKAKKSAKKEDDFNDYDDEDDDSNFTRIVIFAGIVCILLLLILVKVFTNESTGSLQDELEPVEGSIDVEMYLDFSCRHSKDAWQAMIELKGIYGDALNVKVKHFPLSVEDIDVENAIQCARDQGKHMQYIERLFENTNNLNVNSLKNYAWAEGLDIIEFHDCVDNQEHLDRIKADLGQGVGKGVRKTPTFFIGDEMIVGLRSTEFFKEKINDKLGLE